jgi:hypothetical protein
VGTRIAFVSTNSITQGEQVAPLWRYLFSHELSILFGHRTFRWESEARGKAHVHVVIIGLARPAIGPRFIFDYRNADGTTGDRTAVGNISPYLTEGSSLAIGSRSRPVSAVPPTRYGSKPVDGGHLIIEDDEHDEFLAACPQAAAFVRPLLCADEYLDGRRRWCLWLVNASPREIRSCPEIIERVRAVRSFRLDSTKEKTRQQADTPALFGEIRQPTSPFLVIPLHTSESRNYIPFGYFSPDHIVHNSCSALPDATPYHFGILHSAMHMAWVRQVCGRIKSDYRYSARLVYNNYPWPDAPTDAQRQRVEEAAQAVLDARAQFPDATLADLYDPLSMPAALRRAHNALDRAVDRCYRPQPFPDERRRFEFLFERYEQLTAPLTSLASRKRRARRK